MSYKRRLKIACEIQTTEVCGNFTAGCSGNRISPYTCISTRKVIGLLKTVNSLLQEE